MLPRSFFHRSLNIKAPWKQQGLDVAFQSFKCKRDDVYFMDDLPERTNVPPVTCSFSKVNPDFLAVADEDGNILVLNTLQSGPLAVAKDWHAHSNAVFDIDWMPGENVLVTASGDQTLALWDVQAQKQILLFSGHTSSVKSVAFQKNSKDLLISGSRDGHIMLWDKRVNMQQDESIKYIHDIPGAHDTHQNKKSTGNKLKNSYSVTSVSFQNENTFASAGCADGSIKLWDLRKLSGNRSLVKCKSTFACQSKNGRHYGISNLIFDHSESYLFASCLDGSIYQYDCINYKSMPVTCYRGHKVKTFFVKLSISPDDSYIMSGSTDCSAYIWPIRSTHHRGDVGMPSGPIKLVGHTEEVTSVAWCQSDILKVVTLSDDHTACIWRFDRREVDSRYDDVEDRPYGHAVKDHVKSVILTPRKCFFTSPIKRPPTPSKVIQSLTNLPSTLKMSSPAPTITSFFSKSSLKKPQHATTPKKIILSPRKAGCGSGLNARGVKRKLCIDDEDSKGDVGGAKSSKLQKLDSNSDNQMDWQQPPGSDNFPTNQENNERGNPLSSLFSSFSLGLSTSSSSKQNVLSEISPNMMSNDLPASTPLEKEVYKSTENSFAKVIYNIKEAPKVSSVVTGFSSPTANLPDSVRDAYYKKIKGKHTVVKHVPSNRPPVDHPEIPKTPQSSKVNWLTQLSMKKNLEKTSSSQEPSPAQAKTPGRSRTNKGSGATPKTPKTTPKIRRR